MQTETQTPIAPIPLVTPSYIAVTESAASKIKDLLAEEGKSDSGLRVFVQGGGCSGFQYGLMI
jgi:iron-sulfur cluster insertion protein